MASIGLISDVHATAAPVQEALAIFARAGVDRVLCAGDIAGYHDEVEQTVALLVDNDVQAVRGNHDLRYLDRCDEGEDGPVAIARCARHRGRRQAGMRGSRGAAGLL
jgi:predicted phosphodiesterase